MILLPIAENAVKHGPAAGHRGTVRFAVRVEESALEVTVENPGPYRGPRAGSEGLPTVQRRLDLAYGEASSIRVTGEGERTKVVLRLPREGPRSGINV